MSLFIVPPDIFIVVLPVSPDLPIADLYPPPYSFPVIVEAPVIFIVVCFVVPLSLFPPYMLLATALLMFTC